MIPQDEVLSSPTAADLAADEVASSTLWPGGFYVVGWIFAAVGAVQVGVAATRGLWRLIRRCRESRGAPSSQTYAALALSADGRVSNADRSVALAA